MQMTDHEAPQVFAVGDFRVDSDLRTLFTADGTRVTLPSRAFDLLLYLVQHPGELHDKNRLMDAVWPNAAVEENNLNQCVGALRKALGERPGDHKYLVTEPGRGYRLVAPVKLLAPALAATPTSRRARLDTRLVAIGAIAALGIAVASWMMSRNEPTGGSLDAGDSSVPAARDAYSRALAFAERTTRSEADIGNAILAYEEAVRLDPRFARAWAQLSRRHSNLISISYDRSPQRRAAAESTLRKALELAPNSVDSQSARGYFLFRVEGDLVEAEKVFRALAAREAGDANLGAGLAQITREAGRWNESLTFYAELLAKDPQNPYSHAIVCEDYLTGRELELAQKARDRALDLSPNDIGAVTLKASIYQASGDLLRAHDLLAGVRPAPGDWRTLRILSQQLFLERDAAAAARLLETYLSNPQALGARLGPVRRRFADAQRLLHGDAAARPAYETAHRELAHELERQPANPSLLAELAIVSARLGDHESAAATTARCSELAIRTRRESLEAECGSARAEIAVVAGRTDEAKRLLAKQLVRRGELPPLTPALLELDPRWSGLATR
jgi:DNA-binding winged helix-turn-helix (wHTH) protein/Flp pilus assembly protein TadD